MDTTAWVKRTTLDDEHMASTTVEVPDDETIAVSRAQLERFLTEAGYVPEEPTP